MARSGRHDRGRPWDGGGRETWPVPSPRFVGRERELSLLLVALRRPGSLVLVAGEAGVGKTRLIREALAGTPVGPSSRVLYAACPPLRTPLTLGAIVSALRGAGLDVAALGLDPIAGALRPLLPEWADLLPEALPEPVRAEDARSRLFGGLRHLLERAGVTHLVVDDLHWADETTVEFLLELTSVPDGCGIVASFRPGDLHPDSLVRTLAGRSLPGRLREQVDLGPLAPDQTGALASSMLGGEPVASSLVEVLQRRTEGLPLAVEETMRQLRGGELSRTDDGWSIGALDLGGVPPMLATSFLERAQRLGEPAMRVLRATAVLGGEASVDLALAVAGLEPGLGHEALHAAVSSGFLVEDDGGGLAFRHVLASEAVYDAIPLHLRRGMHLLAARGLESRAPLPLAALLLHFHAGGDLASWATRVGEAADAALSSGAAARAFAMVIEVVDTAAVPLDLRIAGAQALAAAEAFRRTSDRALVEQVAAAIERAAALDGVPAATRAALLSPVGRLRTQLGDFAGGVALLEEALPGLEEPAELARALLFLGLPLGSRRPAPECAALLHRAAGLIHHLSPDEAAGQRTNLMIGLLLLGDAAGWELSEQLPDGDPARALAAASGHANAAYAGRIWGRYDAAFAHLERGDRIATEQGLDQLHHSFDSTRAHLLWATGRWDALRELVDAASKDSPANVGVTLEIEMLDLLLESQRDPAPASAGLAERIDDLCAAGLGGPASAMLSDLLLGEGRVAEAVTATDEVAGEIVERGLWVWSAEVMPARVRALLAAEDAPGAADLVRRFASGLADTAAPAPQAALAECRALLLPDDQPETAASWGEVAAAWDRLPAPRSAALARVRQATSLARTGHHGDAVELFESVRRAQLALGAHRDAYATEHAAAAWASYVPRGRAPGRPSYGNRLSPREEQVLVQVVAGRTNKEIAAELSVSPKTVERHLENIRSKLGATSRAALVALALRSGHVA